MENTQQEVLEDIYHHEMEWYGSEITHLLYKAFECIWEMDNELLEQGRWLGIMDDECTVGSFNKDDQTKWMEFCGTLAKLNTAETWTVFHELWFIAKCKTELFKPLKPTLKCNYSPTSSSLLTIVWFSKCSSQTVLHFIHNENDIILTTTSDSFPNVICIYI